MEELVTPSVDWAAFAPLLALSIGALFLLTAAAFTPTKPGRGTYAAITAIAGVAAMASAWPLWDRIHDEGPFTNLNGAVTIDGFSIFFTFVIAASVVLAALLLDDYLRREQLDGPEMYALMLLSAAGGIVMAMGNDLMVIFLGLETLSIALYVMAGFHLRRRQSQEAGMKYFVLGAFSSAFLLYGIALVYGATGTTNLSSLRSFLSGNLLESDSLLLAVVQTDVKRMMAYSSISHAGFILVGVQVATEEGSSAVLFYLAAYTFMIIGTFGVATLVGGRGDDRHTLDDYNGLSKRRPGLALVFAVFLLAQAGVPLTTGFLSKFYVIGAAVEAESYALAVIAMVSAVISAFLYLRIIVAMYMGDDETERPAVRVPLGAGIALGLALAFTLVVGLLPDVVVGWANDAVPLLLSAG